MYQRKISNIILNKSFQYKYAGVAMGATLVSIGVVWMCVWLFNRGGVFGSETTAVTPDLQAAIVDFAKYVTLRVFLMSVAVSVFAILVSHKMAGPMYRFQRTLESVTGGDLTARAFLREGDDLNEVKEALNQAITSVHSRVRHDKEKTVKAAETIKSVRETMSAGLTPEGLEGIAGKLKNLESELHEIGKRFKV